MTFHQFYLKIAAIFIIYMEHQKGFLADLQEGMQDDPHVFTPDELMACRDEGECCNCGMCCLAFAHEIPNHTVEVQETLEVVRKDSLAACPWLKDDGTGRFLCGCHDDKYSPAMKACKNWKGNVWQAMKSGPYVHRRRFDAMHQVYFENLITRGTSHDIAIADNMARRGALSGGSDLYNGNISTRSYERFLSEILSPSCPLPELPVALLGIFGIPEWIRERAEYGELHQLMGNLMLNSETPLHVHFFERYLESYFG